MCRCSCTDPLSFDALGKARHFVCTFYAAVNGHDLQEFAELPVYSAAATWTDAVIADVSKFAEGDLKNQSGLAFTGYALGNITLAQSVYRELSTGETRQNLVFKALNGVKARGFKCNQKLLQKCEAILKGHGSKQAK